MEDMVYVPCFTVLFLILLWLYFKFLHPYILPLIPTRWRARVGAWLYPTCPFQISSDRVQHLQKLALDHITERQNEHLRSLSDGAAKFDRFAREAISLQTEAEEHVRESETKRRNLDVQNKDLSAKLDSTHQQNETLLTEKRALMRENEKLTDQLNEANRLLAKKKKDRAETIAEKEQALAKKTTECENYKTASRNGSARIAELGREVYDLRQTKRQLGRENFRLKQENDDLRHMQEEAKQKAQQQGTPAGETPTLEDLQELFKLEDEYLKRAAEIRLEMRKYCV